MIVSLSKVGTKTYSSLFFSSIILSFAGKATPVPLKPTVQNPMKHVEVPALKLLAWLCSDIGIPQNSQKFAGGYGLWSLGWLDVGDHSLVGWMLVAISLSGR